MKTPQSSTYIQYGCGLSAPHEWINYDVSPTLRLQKLPLIGRFMPGVRFPANIRYGDIVKGLPLADQTASGVYCSHVLEHLSLEDCRIALANTFRIMKPGARFRCVVPDLEEFSRDYLQRLDAGEVTASIDYIPMMGEKKRPKTFFAKLTDVFGNTRHRWMWDQHALTFELKKAGFSQVRRCYYHDSEDPMFRHVEDPGRFDHSVALEAVR